MTGGVVLKSGAMMAVGLPKKIQPIKAAKTKLATIKSNPISDFQMLPHALVIASGSSPAFINLYPAAIKFQVANSPPMTVTRRTRKLARFANPPCKIGEAGGVTPVPIKSMSLL